MSRVVARTIRLLAAVLALSALVAGGTAHAASGLSLHRARLAVAAFMRTAKAHTDHGPVLLESVRIPGCRRVSGNRVDCAVNYAYFDDAEFKVTECNATVSARRRSGKTSASLHSRNCLTHPTSHS